ERKHGQNQRHHGESDDLNPPFGWCGREDLNLHGGCPHAPQACASANSATTAFRLMLRLPCPFYFFSGACCCGGFGLPFGFGGLFNGIVSVAPVLGLLSVTDGCPGFTPVFAVFGVIVIGVFGISPGGRLVVFGCCFVAGAGCFSRIVLPTLLPDRRVARM